MKRTCSEPECANTIWKGNTTGRCRSCNTKSQNADPITRARQAASWKARVAADAELRDRIASASQRRLAAWRASPAGASMIDQSRRNLQAARTPDARARQQRSRMRRLMGEIPESRWPEYRTLRKHGGYTAAEARRIIEADTPGTVEYVRRVHANVCDARRIKQELMR